MAREAMTPERMSGGLRFQGATDMHEIGKTGKRVNLNALKRDAFDQRDQRFSLKLNRGFGRARIPDAVDLRAKCSAVEDQGELGSCTAQAVVALIEANENECELARRPGNRLEALRPGGMATTFTDLSRLGLYFNERRLMGTIAEDSGGSIRQTVKAAAKFGVGAEKLWPYVPERFAIEPTSEYEVNALAHKVTSYHRIQDGDLESIKAALAFGHLVACGIQVARSMLSQATEETGDVPTPTTSHFIGGHAIALIGFDDSRERFDFRNSWGIHWGDRGYGTIGYDYVGNPTLANDFWVVTSGWEP